MKTTWLGEMNQLGPVEGVFLVTACEVRLARDGQPYLRLTLADRTGSVDALRWQAPDADQRLARSASYLHIQGRLDLYQGKQQIVIERMKAADGEIDPADFLPSAPRPVAEMMAELNGFVRSLREPQVRRLVEEALRPDGLGAQFAEAPGAIRVHHAYIGGLLDHTLSVARLADSVAERYPELNRDLLLAGAILHDIGKTQEYDWEVRFCASDEGQLLGHITQGVLMVNRLMDAIPDFDPLWRMLISHMIVSHHGELEFGSPRTPMCAEAIALHYLEDMDAKLKIFQQQTADPEMQDMSPNWTRKVQWLGRPLFKGVPGPAKEP